MTPEFFASLTLEMWRASGARTEMRRDYLMTRNLETYFGPEPKWSDDIKALESSARLMLRQRTRIDELQYQ